MQHTHLEHTVEKGSVPRHSLSTDFIWFCMLNTSYPQILYFLPCLSYETQLKHHSHVRFCVLLLFSLIQPLFLHLYTSFLASIWLSAIYFLVVSLPALPKLNSISGPPKIYVQTDRAPTAINTTHTTCVHLRVCARDSEHLLLSTR